MKNISNLKILFVTNNSSFINSHRTELIEKLISLQNEIHLLANFDQPINIKKIKKYPDPYVKNFSLIQLIKKIVFLNNILKKEKYNLIHSIGIKSNFIIFILSYFLPYEKFLLHFTGLGNLFTLKRFILFKYFFCLIFNLFNNKNVFFIFQKKEDYQKIFFLKKINPINLFIIPGSGVDMNFFKKRNTIQDKKKINLLMSSRIIVGKGIDVYIKIANSMKNSNNYQFYFAGKKNISGVGFDFKKYDQFLNSNFTNLGEVKDMKNLLNKIDIIIYPSNYGEGIPKFLIECLSFGLPIISNKNEFSKYLIDDDINGKIVKKNCVKSYINAIKKFSIFDNRKKAFFYSRKKCKKNFDIELIINKHLNYYQLILQK